MNPPDRPAAYALTLSFEAPPAVSPDLRAEAERELVPSLVSDDRITTIHAFTPDADKPIIFDEGDGPALHLELGTADGEAAIAVATEAGFGSMARAIAQKFDAEVSVGLYRIYRTPMPGRDMADPRTAPMSFMVRYYGPTEDDAEFARHYIANHPDILARFTGVRNVLCYEPVAWDRRPLPANPVVVGNEVVFDSVADLNQAMGGGVMKDLRADSAQFPSFGHSTHHPMRRSLVK